jgi:hypothetical protein
MSNHVYKFRQDDLHLGGGGGGSDSCASFLDAHGNIQAPLAFRGICDSDLKWWRILLLVVNFADAH